MPVHRDLLCLQITWRTIVPMVKIIIKASPPGAVQLEVGLDLQSTDDLIRKYSLTSWRHPGAHRGWWKIQLETHILRQNCKHGLMSPKDTVDLFIKKKRKKKIPEGWWFRRHIFGVAHYIYVSKSTYVQRTFQQPIVSTVKTDKAWLWVSLKTWTKRTETNKRAYSSIWMWTSTRETPL